MRSKDRGFLFILVLLLLAILLISGLALLAREGKAYGNGGRAAQQAQAQSLASMGLEDTLIKMEKDFNFPPRQAEDQMIFSWSEEVVDFDTGEPLGQYTVTLDRTHDVDPFWTIKLTCLGRVGPAESPAAVSVLNCELDTSGPRVENRAYGRLVHLKPY